VGKEKEQKKERGRAKQKAERQYSQTLRICFLAGFVGEGGNEPTEKVLQSVSFVDRNTASPKNWRHEVFVKVGLQPRDGYRVAEGTLQDTSFVCERGALNWRGTPPGKDQGYNKTGTTSRP